MSQRSKYCLIGVPDHQGVVNVGGRIGAALGPQAFRRVWARMSGHAPVKVNVRDAGDVPGMGADVATNHRLASDLVREEQRAAARTVIVGGGHDHGYSHLVGVMEALTRGKKRPKLGCINIDAHLDVRAPAPAITSGSPFYLALESGLLDPSRLIEFGIQSHCNARGLWDYVGRKKVEVVGFDRLRDGKAIAAFRQALKKLSARCDAIVVSLDLDAAAQAYAPGTSAPQSEGFTPTELIQMAELAGRASKVASLGIFELNPVHDIDDRTARLGATAVWHFIEAGLVSK